MAWRTNAPRGWGPLESPSCYTSSGQRRLIADCLSAPSSPTPSILHCRNMHSIHEESVSAQLSHMSVSCHFPSISWRLSYQLYTSSCPLDETFTMSMSRFVHWNCGVMSICGNHIFVLRVDDHSLYVWQVTLLSDGNQCLPSESRVTNHMAIHFFPI